MNDPQAQGEEITKPDGAEAGEPAKKESPAAGSSIGNDNGPRRLSGPADPDTYEFVLAWRCGACSQGVAMKDVRAMQVAFMGASMQLRCPKCESIRIVRRPEPTTADRILQKKLSAAEQRAFEKTMRRVVSR